MGRQYLLASIQDDHYRINKYNVEIEQMKSNLINSIPDLTLHLNIVVRRNLHNKENEEKIRLQAKYGGLLHNRHQSYFNEIWVKNISSRTLSNKEINVLGKGLKFNTHHSQQDVVSFIANIEDGINKIRDLSEGDKQILKQRVSTFLH